MRVTLKYSPKIEYNGFNFDYYAPEANAPFVPGSIMNVDYRQDQDNTQDYKWQVTAEQTGTYKLTLDVSDSSNVTLTAEKLENQQ